MSKEMYDNIIICQASPLFNAYGAWLGLDYHNNQVPKHFNNGDVHITYAVDVDTVHHRHKAVWTIHGLDRVYQLKVEIAHHECQSVALNYEGEATLEQLQTLLNTITIDIIGRLQQQCDEIGMPYRNMSFY